jgi:hypothetical protein
MTKKTRIIMSGVERVANPLELDKLGQGHISGIRFSKSGLEIAYFSEEGLGEFRRVFEGWITRGVSREVFIESVERRLELDGLYLANAQYFPGKVFDLIAPQRIEGTFYRDKVPPQ